MKFGSGCSATEVVEMSEGRMQRLTVSGEEAMWGMNVAPEIED